MPCIEAILTVLAGIAVVAGVWVVLFGGEG